MPESYDEQEMAKLEQSLDAWKAERDAKEAKMLQTIEEDPDRWERLARELDERVDQETQQQRQNAGLCLSCGLRPQQADFWMCEECDPDPDWDVFALEYQELKAEFGQEQEDASAP